MGSAGYASYRKENILAVLASIDGKLDSSEFWIGSK